ncbi:MAG: P1 family peptidase [Solirubrobacterales bacterium]|nr:P1 family peptidase [Solirubrobacterales bacterium]MCB0859634.1 P1 family peptidase [Solirubrobacterales bacterium]
MSVATERARDIGAIVGRLPTGPANRITDVDGVRVGHSQAVSGQSTGVTVIAPPDLPARGATATVNGVGELTAKLEIDERGRLETPVYLCGSHAIGTVLQAAIEASGRGPENIVLPVVGECDDGDMADSRTVVAADVEAALSTLGEEVPEGSVGAGTGMSCFDFPGGIGTASRKVGDHTVGVLLLCNFGDREYLDFAGCRFPPPERPAASHGSCIAVCATDAPLPADQMRRLALRPLLGLIRAGSYAAEGSGEIGVAFTTASESRQAGDREMNRLLAAGWEAGWEAVLNCLVAARPGTRLDGSRQDGFPVEEVRARLAGQEDSGGSLS